MREVDFAIGHATVSARANYDNDVIVKNLNNVDDGDFPDTLRIILGGSLMVMQALDLDPTFGAVDSTIDFGSLPLLSLSSLPLPAPLFLLGLLLLGKPLEIHMSLHHNKYRFHLLMAVL